MKLIISGIDWDYPDKENGKPCPDHLPSQVIIDDPILISKLTEDMNEEANNIAEWLTDKYECCVCGFFPKLEGVTAV